MTKKELIELLDHIADDTMILIPGHSDSQVGYNSVTQVCPVIVTDERDDCNWQGEYLDSHDPEDKNVIKAYCLQ